MGRGDGRSLLVTPLSIVIHKREIHSGGFASPFRFLKATVSKHCPLGDLDVKLLSPPTSREEDVVCTS